VSNVSPDNIIVSHGCQSEADENAAIEFEQNPGLSLMPHDSRVWRFYSQPLGWPGIGKIQDADARRDIHLILVKPPPPW
jgi:hypothetical protein